MNQRGFVSRDLSAIVAGPQAAQPRLLAASPAWHEPQWLLASDRIGAGLRADGPIHSMGLRTREWERVEFCVEPFAGPQWANEQLESRAGSASSFVGTADGIRHCLRYRLEETG
jgi:hypothetical protein